MVVRECANASEGNSSSGSQDAVSPDRFQAVPSVCSATLPPPGAPPPHSRQLGARVDANLVEDSGEVKGDGTFGDEQLVHDGLAGVALGHYL